MRERNQHKEDIAGFPGGSVAKNPPASAADKDSIPDPRRYHMLWSNKDHAPQILSLCSRVQEPQLLKLMRPTVRAAAREATATRSPPITARVACRSSQPEESPQSNEDPAEPKTNK